MIKQYKGRKPEFHPTAYISESVDVIGDFTMGEYSSLWFGTVARADVNKIVIGKYTNIQDRCVIHCDSNHPTVLGDYITVGHGAILHGCTIGDNCLIGMGAIVMDGAEIGENTIIGTGTVVNRGKKIPPNSLVLGAPGKVVREVTEEEIKSNRKIAIHYADRTVEYKQDSKLQVGF